MSAKIFGNEVIRSLNIYEVCFILDSEQWKENYKDFKENFECVDKDTVYVRNTLKKLEGLFGKEISIEIEDVLKQTDKFCEVCSQTVYCENSRTGGEIQRIYLGSCLIDLGRKENPNYII